MSLSKVTSKWQTVVPQAVRNSLGLSYGDSLEWLLNKDGSFNVKPAKVDASEYFGKYHYKVKGKQPLSDQEINERLDKAMRDQFNLGGF